jgi:hypothetical protein
MPTDDPDDLVLFLDVRVIRSTPGSLLCRIGEKSVWLPRGHISGKLWCTGDRGKIFIRRWVAHDRHLIESQRAGIGSPTPSLLEPRLPARLHLVQRDRSTPHAG